MKRIGRFDIYQKKVLNNAELSKLRGGGTCICRNSDNQIVITGAAQSAAECQVMCTAYGANPIYYPDGTRRNFVLLTPDNKG